MLDLFSRILTNLACTSLLLQALGVLHVLTGPDHLSALATLSANVGSCPQAFVLGVRWGVGHSTGLLTVAVILIVLTRNNSQDDTIEVPDRATLVFESLVGTFMILLGAWGIRRALVKRSKIYDVVPTEIGDDNSHEHQGDSEDRSSSLDFLASAEENPHCGGGQCIDHRDPEKGSAFDETDPTDASSNDAGADDETDSVTVQLGSCWRSFVDNVSTRTLAFCAGIIHGLAGPGGILGVSCQSAATNTYCSSQDSRDGRD